MSIEIRQLSKSFGERTVFENLNLTLPDGEVSCITAPSGRGKTTLLRLLMGLEAPDSGCITGVPAKISAVFQEPRLIPHLSARKNAALPLPKGSEGRAGALLTRLGLGESLSVPAASLSGGMARRVALARALLAEGELLLLDEPFEGLDGDSRALALEAVREHTANRTVLLVTHRREEAEALGARVLAL